MERSELLELSRLATKFANWETTHLGSINGRKMDIAIATSLASSLLAYGASFNLELSIDIEAEEQVHTHHMRGFNTFDDAHDTGTRLLGTCGLEDELPGKVIAFKIV